MDQPITRAEHISIHALREEGDPFSAVRFWLQKVFLSTPSARRATLAACAALHADAISIHALREEGDTVPSSETTSVEDFYPRPPRGGRLQPVFQGKNCCLNFYPRPPRGGRPINLGSGAMRGDFYPRPPRGGRRLRQPSCRPPQRISIHALREEGDKGRRSRITGQKDFYPRPPRGGRPAAWCSPPMWGLFLSTPSARRATHQRISDGAGAAISIHALREEGDLSHPPFATF